MVQVGNEDWRDMQRRVSKLEGDHVGFRISLDTLVAQQASQHAENKTHISHVTSILEGDGTDDNPGIKMTLDRVRSLVNNRFDDIRTLIKTIAWAIGILLTGVGLWFSTLEYRHRLNTDNTPQMIGQQHLQIDASAGPTHY